MHHALLNQGSLSPQLEQPNQRLQVAPPTLSHLLQLQEIFSSQLSWSHKLCQCLVNTLSTLGEKKSHHSTLSWFLREMERVSKLKTQKKKNPNQNFYEKNIFMNMVQLCSQLLGGVRQEDCKCEFSLNNLDLIQKKFFLMKQE